MTPEAIAELQVALERLAAEEGWQQKIVVLPTGFRIVNDEFTSDELEGYREQFQQNKQCTHCGGLHLRACRRVRKIIMRNREEISEVEFWRDGQWDEEGIIWPEDVWDTTAELLEEDDDGEEAGQA
jgi:hypothetical protein